jgi:hypothetical protein
VELLVGALVVLGFLAILIRFLPRDTAGRVQLPRIIDQSIGMWLLRRAIAGRRGDGAWDDEVERDLRPSSSEWTPVAADADLVAGTPAVAPIWQVVSSSARPASPEAPPPTVAQPVRTVLPRPSRPVRIPPSKAYRRAAVRVAQGLAAVVALTTVLSIWIVVAGVALRQTSAPNGEVLAATGTPRPSPRSTATPITADTTAPTAAIVGLSKKPISGTTLVRVTVTWTLTEAGSGVKSQVLQRRIDNGAWETIPLPSSATRSLAQRLPRGHKYTFRVRVVDRAGNVGPFASRFLYI